MFVLLELGCIECGAATATSILGSFPTLDDGLTGMAARLVKDNEARLARGWHPLTIDQRPEIEYPYEYWSPSLVADAGETNWRLQLHRVDA